MLAEWSWADTPAHRTKASYGLPGGSPPDGDISCTAEGTNEIVDRIIVLTKIHVHYTLRLPAGADREKVDRALATHVAKCPTAVSIRDAVEIGWSVEVVEE